MQLQQVFILRTSPPSVTLYCVGFLHLSFNPGRVSSHGHEILLETSN